PIAGVGDRPISSGNGKSSSVSGDGPLLPPPQPAAIVIKPAKSKQGLRMRPNMPPLGTRRQESRRPGRGNRRQATGDDQVRIRIRNRQSPVASRQSPVACL